MLTFPATFSSSGSRHLSGISFSINHSVMQFVPRCWLASNSSYVCFGSGALAKRTDQNQSRLTYGCSRFFGCYVFDIFSLTCSHSLPFQIQVEAAASCQTFQSASIIQSCSSFLIVGSLPNPVVLVLAPARSPRGSINIDQG